MLIAWFTAYDNGVVNEDNPLEIVGYAWNRHKWTIIIEDNEGNEIDSFVADRLHSLRTTWTPKADMRDGEYNVYAIVESIDEFKVTTDKVPFNVMMTGE
jgi:lactocepin